MSNEEVIKMANEGTATLEDMYDFYEKKDKEFVIHNGVVTDVLHR